MKPILALSTSWCSHRYQDGYAMLQEMAGLGFGHVELSHGIRLTLVPGILRAVEEGVVQVSSTHNFCPLPTGVMQPAPNLYEPSALDPQEHEQWLRHTKRSIDFAALLKARVLVCHLGSVRFSWLDPARRIRKFLRDHPDSGRTSGDTRYQELLQEALRKLRKQMPRYWDQVNTGVRAILDYARTKDVKLGFENRERFEELPLDEDHREFLASLGPDAPVGYWHDTGHADIKEGMGLLDHRMHLESLASCTLGFHLHDVSAEGRDHQPVGTGRIDFEMISRFWRPEHLLTLELGPRVLAGEVLASKRHLDALIENAPL